MERVMSKGKRPRAPSIAGPLPTFAAILASETIPDISVFLQLGRELCTARLDQVTPRQIQDPNTRQGQLTHQLLYYTGKYSQDLPEVGLDAIERELESILKEKQWLYVRDELRLVAAKLKDRLQDSGKDTLRDTRKNPQKRRKYGPRNSTEFLKFKAAMEKGMKKNRSKTGIAAEFANGDAKKAAALLKQYYRHPTLPE
jgi:hypothetical protein